MLKLKEKHAEAYKFGVIRFEVTCTVVAVLCLTYMIIPVLIHSYCAMLEESPIFTKAMTSATVYTIGDMIAQRTENQEGNTKQIRSRLDPSARRRV